MITSLWSIEDGKFSALVLLLALGCPQEFVEEEATRGLESSWAGYLFSKCCGGKRKMGLCEIRTQNPLKQMERCSNAYGAGVYCSQSPQRKSSASPSAHMV